MATTSAQRERVPVAIRDFQPEDYSASVEIANLWFPDDRTTVDEEKWEDEHWDGAKYVRAKYVAVEPRGSVVGLATFSHTPNSFHPQRFGFWVSVHPDWTRRGVGQTLYEQVLEGMRPHRPIALRTWVKESMSDAAAWVERRGLRELMRAWESRLPLATFDASQFQDHWDLPPGIEVVTLAEELARDPEALRRLFDLDNAVGPDMPRIDPHTPMDFAMYRSWVLESPGSNPDGILVAKDGDTYVGMTELFKGEAEKDVFFTGTTGVLRSHRGRGIAFALKLRSLDWAKRNGYREVRTWNSTLNAPMLGINVKLGFLKQPPWITFGKDFSE
jgi:GNAT superfamily N-acetyltransferase